MKKALSVILAIITMFSIAIPVFAADETVKDVDNTFDNYEPAPGQKAPDNWYDPWSYDADGHILYDALSIYEGRNAFYCQKEKKIFTSKSHFDEAKGIGYYPYETIIDYVYPNGAITQTPVYYCPYCGVVGNFKNDFYDTHTEVEGIMYGSYCTRCDGFNATFCWGQYTSGDMYCHHCIGAYYPTKVCRFTSETQRNSEYSFIFTETEYQFGDGKDGKIEDLKMRNGFGVEWNDSSQKLTFWQKIAAFFAKIGAWFKNLFK